MLDRPICIAGTFNKLMEKLNGIHEDVAMLYITTSGASAKFPKLAEAEALNYLQSLSNPETLEQYQAIKYLLKQIETSGSLMPIWHDIQEVVKTKLWDEFKEAYGNINNPHFLSLLENGQYLPAVDVTKIKIKLQESKGHVADINDIRMEHHSLWATRHNSVEDQAAFDKQFGLISK